MEYSLQELIASKGDLPSTLSGQVNVGSLYAVPDLEVKREALFLDVVKKILPFVQIFLGVLSDKKH